MKNRKGKINRESHTKSDSWAKRPRATSQVSKAPVLERAKSTGITFKRITKEGRIRVSKNRKRYKDQTPSFIYQRVITRGN